MARNTLYCILINICWPREQQNHPLHWTERDENKDELAMEQMAMWGPTCDISMFAKSSSRLVLSLDKFLNFRY